MADPTKQSICIQKEVVVLVREWAANKQSLPLGRDDPMVQLIAEFVETLTLSRSPPLIAATCVYFVGAGDTEVRATKESLGADFAVPPSEIEQIHKALMLKFYNFAITNTFTLRDGGRTRRLPLTTPLSTIKKVLPAKYSPDRLVVVNKKGDPIQFCQASADYFLKKASANLKPVADKDNEESEPLLNKKL